MADTHPPVPGPEQIAERRARLPEWIIGKLKTLDAYYEPPTDGRDVVSEIQGWMHVLCFHYVQNRRDVKEYDAARRRAKELEAALAAERERVRLLEEAAKPFGRMIEYFDIELPHLQDDEAIHYYDPKSATIGDLRRLAALLPAP